MKNATAPLLWGRTIVPSRKMAQATASSRGPRIRNPYKYSGRKTASAAIEIAHCCGVAGGMKSAAT